jgi:hypothetical protein
MSAPAQEHDHHENQRNFALTALAASRRIRIGHRFPRCLADLPTGPRRE